MEAFRRVATEVLNAQCLSTPDSVETWRTRLRDAVDRSGKKHSFIAEEAGIDPTTLSRILTGKMRTPGFPSVVRIAHAAGESVGWILGEYGYSISEEERTRLRDAAAAILDVTSVGRVMRGSRT